MKRYQYSRLGLRSVAKKRHVQSESALMLAVPPTRIFLKSGVVEISTTSFLATLSFTGGRLVHRMTLLAVGSPDATPCGKRSRRSMANVGTLFAHPFFVAMAKPVMREVCRNLRRDIFIRCQLMLLRSAEMYSPLLVTLKTIRRTDLPVLPTANAREHLTRVAVQQSMNAGSICSLSNRPAIIPGRSGNHTENSART